jgi:hypothetical protein
MINRTELVGNPKLLFVSFLGDFSPRGTCFSEFLAPCSVPTSTLKTEGAPHLPAFGRCGSFCQKRYYDHNVRTHNFRRQTLTHNSKLTTRNSDSAPVYNRFLAPLGMTPIIRHGH